MPGAGPGEPGSTRAGAVAWPGRLQAANPAAGALEAAIEEGFTADQIATVTTGLAEAAKRLQQSCAHQRLAAASAVPGIPATRALRAAGDTCGTTSRPGPIAWPVRDHGYESPCHDGPPLCQPILPGRSTSPTPGHKGRHPRTVICARATAIQRLRSALEFGDIVSSLSCFVTGCDGGWRVRRALGSRSG
jgi:hypothetical protein